MNMNAAKETETKCVFIVEAIECWYYSWCWDESERRRRRNGKIYKLFSDLHIDAAIVPHRLYAVATCMTTVIVHSEASIVFFNATAGWNRNTHTHALAHSNTRRQTHTVRFLCQNKISWLSTLMYFIFGLFLYFFLLLFVQFNASPNALRDDDTHLRFHFTYYVTQGTVRSPATITCLVCAPIVSIVRSERFVGCIARAYTHMPSIYCFHKLCKGKQQSVTDFVLPYFGHATWASATEWSNWRLFA